MPLLPWVARDYMTQSGPEAANPAGISKVASVAAWAIILLSAVVLAGWVFNLRPLQYFLPVSLSMKANSAVCAILAAVALLRRDHRDRYIYASLASLLALLTLAQYYWTPDLGIDQLLFRDTHFHTFPGRMSQFTSEGFLGLAVSLLFMKARPRLLRALSHAFAILTALWGGIVLVTYAFNFPSDVLIGPHRNVSVPTAICFMLGGIGVLYAHSAEGFVRILHASNPGGAMLRRLLPASIAATLVLGLAVVDLQKYYRWEFGFTSAMAGGVVTLCLIVALALTAFDLEREDVALRDSERRFRLAANSAPVKIWVTGPDRQCTYVNERWLKFRGRSLEQELGRGWTEGLHPEDLVGCMSTLTDQWNRRQPTHLQYRLRRHDGEYRWMVDNGVPRFVDGVFAGYIGSVVDVTDHKLAEEALAILHRKVLEAQEEERSRIARELHDDINQRIAVLTWQLSSATQKANGSDPAIRSAVATSVTQLRNLANDIQAISRRLHSSHLEYLGLGTAAAALCREVSEQQEVQVNFKSDPNLPHLPKDISLALYRVLQEALQNAIKYSGVRAFCVELAGDKDEARLTIVDHGAGFDPHSLNGHHGLGLISMRERMRLVHGEFEVDSKLGYGTTIRVRVPVPADYSVDDSADDMESTTHAPTPSL